MFWWGIIKYTICVHFIFYFPQFIVIYIVKGFGIVNKAVIDVILELSCFFDVAEI